MIYLARLEHAVRDVTRARDVNSRPWANAAAALFQQAPPIVITGLGKSGLVAQRVAASWTSLGIRSVFVHPVDGLHGDYRIQPRKGLLVALSWSGLTAEVADLMSHAQRDGRQVRTLAVTGPDPGRLKYADVVLTLPDVEEPLHPAPLLASTLQSIALDVIVCDALANHRHDVKKFVDHHPGGAIGEGDYGPTS